MKIFNQYITIIFSLIAFTAQAKEDDAISVTYSTMQEIEGSSLMRIDMSTAKNQDDKIRNDDCRIGYMKRTGKESKTKFVTLLTLPTLKNDSYITKVKNGRLHVATKISKTMVLILDIESLAPTLLIER